MLEIPAVTTVAYRLNGQGFLILREFSGDVAAGVVSASDIQRALASALNVSTADVTLLGAWARHLEREENCAWWCDV